MRVSVILAVLAAFISAGATEYEYVPLVREGVQWFYLNETAYPGIQYSEPRVDVYEIIGDSVVNGVSYKKVVNHNWGMSYIVRLIREEDQKVYILSDGRYYCGIDYNLQTGETLIYDFSRDGAGYDNIFSKFYARFIEINESLRWAYYFHPWYEYNGYDPDSPDIIEGIGMIHDYAPFFNPSDGTVPEDDSQYNLSHVIENGEIVYKTKYFNDYEYFMNTGKALSYYDVNGDHSLNVADVSALYSIILNDSRFIDINGDNKMNVADVSALYSNILGN